MAKSVKLVAVQPVRVGETRYEPGTEFELPGEQTHLAGRLVKKGHATLPAPPAKAKDKEKDGEG